MLFFLKLRTWYAPRGGGGGTLIFSSYAGSGPASTVHPQNISGISSTPKHIINLSNPQKYPYSVPWPYEKTPKCIEMTPKYSPILWWPQKLSTKSPYPKNIYFSENPKNIEIQNFEPKKWPEPTYVWNIRVPSPLLWVSNRSPKYLRALSEWFEQFRVGVWIS